MTEHAYFAFCSEYKAEAIAGSLRRGLSALNLEGAVKSGDRVLLKPNLVIAEAPEFAVTTHPEMVRAVAMVLDDCGARLYLGDSPGFGSNAASAVTAARNSAPTVLSGLVVDLSFFRSG